MELTSDQAHYLETVLASSKHGHSGAMVALTPADPESVQLGNVPAEELHVTLSYLGDAGRIPQEHRDRILAIAKEIASHVPLKVKVGGSAYLKDGGCTVLLVDSPEIRLVHDLVEDLIGSQSSYPGYLPHITVDYGDPKTFSDGDLPDELELGALRVAFAGENFDYNGLVAAPSLPTPGRKPLPRGEILRKAGRIFDELLHPRGKDGKFIRKGGLVRGRVAFLQQDGSPDVRSDAVARVVAVSPDGVLEVVLPSGRRGAALAKDVVQTRDVKASIPRSTPLTPEQRRAKTLKAMRELAVTLTDDPVQRAGVLAKLMGNLRGNPVTTDHDYNRRGRSGDEWEDSRVAQHEALWDEIQQKVSAAGIGRDRRSLILGGPPGAGKSFSLLPGEAAGHLGVVAWDLSGDPPEGVTHVVMNPDVIKEMMISHGMLPSDLPREIRPREAVSVIHAESNFLTKMFMSRLAADDYNVVYDSTMANVGHVEKNVRALAEAGYTFSGLYVKIPKEESRISAQRRYIAESLDDPILGGRFVPPEASSAWDTEGTFDSFTSWFTDGWAKVDNTGLVNGAPRKEVYREGTGDGTGLHRFLNPPARKVRTGDPMAGEHWVWGQGAVSAEAPDTELKRGGMSLSSWTDQLPRGDGFFASAADDSEYWTDVQAALGLHSGVLTPDEYLALLKSDLVLVSPATSDDSESYLGASTIPHEVLRLGRGGLLNEIADEVVRLRATGLVHDSAG